MTHTIANLPVSEATYRELESRLRAAGYPVATEDGGLLDLSPFGVTIDSTGLPTGFKLSAAPLTDLAQEQSWILHGDNHYLRMLAAYGHARNLERALIEARAALNATKEHGK